MGKIIPSGGINAGRARGAIVRDMAAERIIYHIQHCISVDDRETAQALYACITAHYAESITFFAHHKTNYCCSGVYNAWCHIYTVLNNPC